MEWNSLKDTYCKLVENYGKRLLSGLIGVGLTYLISFICIELLGFFWAGAIMVSAIVTTIFATWFERIIKYQDTKLTFKEALVKRTTSAVMGMTLAAMVSIIVIELLHQPWYIAFILPSVISFNFQFMLEILDRYQAR